MSHEVKCFAVGHRVMSVPHSATMPQDRVGAEAMDLSEVDAEERVERRAHIEGRLVLRRLLRVTFGRARSSGVALLVQSVQGSLDLDVAVAHLGVVEVVQFQRLSQREDVLGAVVAGERFADGVRLSWQRTSRKSSKRSRVAFAGDDRANDAHAGEPGNVRDDVVQLDVHLHERLLHVLNVRGRVVDQPLTMPQVRAQRTIARRGRKLPR